MRRAFFRIGKLGNDRQAGKRADGVNCEQHFFNVGKGLENVEIDAALFERHCLLVKNVQYLFVVRMARLDAEPERPDGARDQHFARGGFAGFASDFYAPAVQTLHFVAESQRRELEAIRGKRVRLDDLRARFDIRLVHAKNRFRLRSVQLVEATLRAYDFVEHRAHRSIGDENRVLQPLIEIVNFHVFELKSFNKPRIHRAPQRRKRCRLHPKRKTMHCQPPPISNLSPAAGDLDRKKNELTGTTPPAEWG